MTSLSPRTQQIIGAVGLVVQLGFWMATGQIEPLLLAPFGAWMTGWQIADTVDKFKGGSK
jgi:hypothetical protein